eukprot:2800012-Pleurochrysis_carterae.AAC.1
MAGGGCNTVERHRSRRHRACCASGDARGAAGATYRLLGSFHQPPQSLRALSGEYIIHLYIP